MSDGNQSTRAATLVSFVAAVFVLAGTLVYVFQMGLHSGLYEAKASGYAAHYPYDTRKQIAECWREADRDAAIECVNDAVKSSREYQRSEQDLSAQQQMSEWAFWALVTSICSAIVTAIGTYMLYKQIILTKEAVAETSKATLEIEQQNKLAAASQRAWLNIEFKFSPSHTDHGIDSKHFWIEVITKNNGQSVARDISYGTMLVSDQRPENIYQLAKEHMMLHPERDSLPPNGTQSYFMTGSLSTREFEGPDIPGWYGHIGKIYVFIVAYRTLNDKDSDPRRHTIKVCCLGEKGRGAFSSCPEHLDINNLVMLPMWMGPGYAD